MSLFDDKITLDKTIRTTVLSKDYDYTREIEIFDFTKYLNTIKDEELLSDILLKFVNHNIDFTVHINYITNMFTSICLSTSKEEIGIFKGLVDIYLENQNLFLDYNNFDKAMNAFDDKKIVLELFRSFSRHNNIKDNDNSENISALIDYVIRARKYYVDDRALLASTISLLDEIDPVVIKYGEKEKINEIVEARLKEDRKANGVYDIDRTTISELNEKIDELQNSKNSVDILLELINNQIEILRLELKRNKDELTETKIRELSAIKSEAAKIIKEFNTTYLELLNSQRETIINEKDMMMSDFLAEVDKVKAEFDSFAGSIGRRVNTEIKRVNNITSESEKRLREFVDNNDKIGQMISTAVANEELLERINNVTSQPQIITPTEETIQTSSILTPADIQPSGIITPSASQILIPDSSIHIDTIRKPSNKTIYPFNTIFPFKERYQHLMDLKQKDIEENGTFYHAKFDDILKLIIQGEVPYLEGPTGSGKTYLIYQIAKLLELKVITNGYVLYEQDIIGYTNSATGKYVPSNFYRAYKFGDIIFFDEFDNGVANATVVLNRFLGKNNTDYIFPDGELVKRHPNFRVVTAGNTNGNGRTEAYNTRSKLDESVSQRLVQVEVGYDNRIEKAILKDYPDWYKFAMAFRSAVESIRTNSGEDINTIGTFTTRDAESIKMHKDDESFNDRQIMEYKIVGNKDIDYLSQIERNLEVSYNNDLFNIFHDVIKEKKRKIKCKWKQ